MKSLLIVMGRAWLKVAKVTDRMFLALGSPALFEGQIAAIDAALADISRQEILALLSGLTEEEKLEVLEQLRHLFSNPTGDPK